ncbi:hypothetical protein OAJ27_01460 [bacterium]|nr:hypothetical protein [bacterium]
MKTKKTTEYTHEKICEKITESLKYRNLIFQISQSSTLFESSIDAIVDFISLNDTKE